MRQILLVYGFQKENVTAIITFNKDTKSTPHSFDSDIGLFDNVTGVLQTDTQTPYLLIIYPDDVI